MIIVLLTAGAAYSVTWEAGLKMGANSARLRGDPVSLWVTGDASELAGTVGDYKLGFIGGLYARADFNDYFGIQAEVVYTQAGGEGTVAGSAIITQPNQIPQLAEFEGILKLHLDYVQVPVLAAFSFAADDEKRVMLRALVGPTFAYCASAEVQLTGEASMEMPDTNERLASVDERRDAGDYVENVEIGAIIGFSISYALDNVDIVLDARWGRGFTTIDNTTNGRSTYNSGVSIQAGIAIPFGR
jgi:hypothetical protein